MIRGKRALGRHLDSLPILPLLAVGATLIASAGMSQPLFLDRSDSLTAPPSYDGGWEHFVGGGVAIFDCNGDDKLDLFVAGGDNPVSLLVNETRPEGRIVFSAQAIDAMQQTIGAYPLDVDADGNADLFVLRSGPNRVLLGSGDCTFTDATLRLGIDPGNAWTTSFSATWETGQTLPTLAIGNYVDAADPEGPFGTCDTNWLVRPDGQSYAPKVALEPGFCPLSMLFSDWRRDSTAMLRISNDRQYYVRDGYEQMWSLDPLREWTEADGWDRMQLWGMGIASGDLTGDGLPEVMLTSMGDQMLMANSGSGFETVPYETGTFAHRPHTGEDGRPSTGWHAEFGDVDNDGLADLFIAKGNVDQMPSMAIHDPNNLLIQQSDGRFTEAAADAGIATTERSRGAGLADLNNDGLLDIVVVNRRAPLEIWQNVTPDAGNWLGVRLQQSGGNRWAIGAHVEVRTGIRVQTQELTIGGGHASGSLAPAHFGLGSAEQARVRVLWPDQTASDWQTIAANQVVVVTREAALE